MPARTRFSRRSLLAGAGLAAGAAAQTGRITDENRRAGTVDWQLRYYRTDRTGGGSSLRSPQLEGYASEVSVYPGESIGFHVSTNPPRQFTIDIYRTGYYGGAGGRHMHRLGPLRGETQPVPLMGSERIRECAWKSSATLDVPGNWPSGVYLAKLTLVDEPVQSYAIFVVKSKQSADFLFQVSDLTWQAYNKWPGWDSLYDDGLPKDGNGFNYTGPNVRVSFDRPYGVYGQVHRVMLSLGSGEYLLWEHPMSYWLEQHGYDVSYCSNLDIERDPDLLRRCKVFLSVGHDEYWTRGMYDHVKAARDRGVSLGFFSGNSVYHEIATYQSSVTGRPLRGFARKQRFPDEDQLMGAKSYGSGYADYTVVRADHWMFEGTGMKDGDSIRGLVGWEFHGTPAKLPGLVEVARSQLAPYTRRPGQDADGWHSSVIFPCEKGNWVFNAGTIWWAEGLSNPPGHAPAGSQISRSFGVDHRVQRITTNLLQRFLKDSPIRF